MRLVQETISLPQKYSIPEDAIEARDRLLELSQCVMFVCDPTTQEQATKYGRAIQEQLQAVESARQTLTSPLLAAQRKLMELSKDYCAKLVAEKARLGQLVSTFQLQERQRAEAEALARQAEIKRLAEIEALAKAKADEAAFVAHIANDETQAMADIAAAQAEMLASEAEATTMTAIMAPIPAPTKATGAATKTELCFEVTDIHKLYAARPDLCKAPEAKASAIKGTQNPPKTCTIANPAVNIPGLKMWWETRTSFRR